MTSITSTMPRSRASEELRRRVLALVLALVLAWYTFIVIPPAGSSAAAELPPTPPGGEKRDAGASIGDLQRRGAGASAAARDEAAGDAEDDLEWPEFIDV